MICLLGKNNFVSFRIISLIFRKFSWGLTLPTNGFFLLLSHEKNPSFNFYLSLAIGSVGIANPPSASPVLYFGVALVFQGKYFSEFCAIDNS